MGLKIMQWNARSVQANKRELINFLSQEKENKTKIICIQETMLKQGDSFTLPLYDQQRKDQETRTGGVMTLIKNNVNYTQLPSPKNIEAIGTKIHMDQTEINLFNIYIPPRKPVDLKELESIFQYNNCIITGDLNAHNKLWNSDYNNKMGNTIEELMDKYDFSVLNTGQPTHQKQKGGMTSIDITIVSNSLVLNSTWHTINNTLGSDHQPTFTTLNQNH
jgi:exonuclease III